MPLPVPPSFLRARSPKLARALLLTALAAGLGGLAVPPASSAPSVSAGPTPIALHGQGLRFTPTPPAPVLTVAQPAPRRVVRATRARVRAPQWVRPVSAPVNSRYGPRWGRMHKGIDFAANYGAPIRAVGAGTVIGAGFLASEGGYGRIVLVRHAGGVVTAYAHTSRTLVRTGQRVKAGQRIALVGSTGHSTGPHLHFEVRIGGQQVNPLKWLRKRHVRV